MDADEKKNLKESGDVPDSNVTDPPIKPAPEPARFPIVGIGASAGGLAAFEAFFSGMPDDCDPGMAFVLVQHLAPDHESILSDLIRRYTRMQVFEVQDGMPVKPNCAYIIPPNRDMAFLNGSLHLLEQTKERGMRLPIDFFFRSLAQDQHERAICIILSGTGSDGTLGVRAVKAEGGMVMAQNPESTEYDGMPRNAIDTGLVDYVLPPAEMASQLIIYANQAYGQRTRPASPPQANTNDEELKKVFILLRHQTGHDFSHYKKNTVLRRVQRRMHVQQIELMDGYVRFLQQTPSEVEALFRDLLIGVTNFFRDPEAFGVLQHEVISKLLTGKLPGNLIRIWVPGCSTGEEAYSIAILLQERLEELKCNFKFQVFATDIDSKAIEQARTGIYPASIATDVSVERLARFFVQEPDGNTYRIQKSIRDMLVFSEQDIIRDPPFSKLDLISCRNLMIYLGVELQKKLIPLFHYALNPGGVLFLGTSETVGDFVDLFSTLDRKAKCYLRKTDERPNFHRATLSNIIPSLPLSEGSPAMPTPKKFPSDDKNQWRELTERTLLRHHATTCVLTNDRGEILYCHGRTGKYLELAMGELSADILKLAREGLQRDLTIALHKSVANKEIVKCPNLMVKTNGDFTPVNLTVRPVVEISDKTPASGLFLVILEESPVLEPQKSTVEGVVADTAEGNVKKTDESVEAQNAWLKQELKAKDEYLQSTKEELETSNEELKSSNEEMQSVNEELQSTNEELETAKEEMQSVNEELATVNAELQTKVADLSRANNDLNNLLSGTGIGTIFVDHQLRILRFTPSVTQVINFISTDVGRHVGHVLSNLANYDSLIEDVQKVMESLSSKQIEVQTKTGEWFLLRIRPYRTLENKIEGAVIIFVDITELKQAREELNRIKLGNEGI